MFIVIRTISVVLLIIVASLNLASCDKAKQMSISGKYVREGNSQRYRELKSDGTLYHQEAVGAVTGTYKIEKNQITFMYSNGMASRSKLDGNTIIDDDGERWTKK